ncbi:MAG TPA: ATP-dependent metallopeptidase FtsH/Yme1/Tma family protein, partial [Acidimicrobiales bacterium]|nr:ATP-dependent metallopeptidase FtsH/Yme1/Tma family protein [Acidimicrobiales bacterium]
MADRKKPTKPSQGKPRPDAGSTRRDQGWPRWGIWLMMGLIGAALFFPSFLPTDEAEVVSYDQFLNLVVADEVTDVQVDNQTGRIHFTTADGVDFDTTGPLKLSDADRAVLAESGAAVEFNTPQPNFVQTWLPLLLPVGLIILFFWWINRRAQGQMTSMMSVGRSKAKTYSSERPGTTFEDVAGYAGVKQEIREVV